VNLNSKTTLYLGFVLILIIVAGGLIYAFLPKNLPACSVDAAIPSGIKMVSPDIKLPSKIKALYGVWEGIWNEEDADRGLPSYLVIESIDATQAAVIISSGDLPQFGIKRGSSRLTAKVSPDGKLTFGRNRDDEYVFSLKNKGILEGEFVESGGGLSKINLTRCTFTSQKNQ
jgi:hypothetical protein